MEGHENIPVVSIIVPIYSVEKYIIRCLDSIVNQTFREIEVILVDDGSPDECGKICDEYAKKDKRITVIHQQNSGVVRARKTGLEHATGKYIGFVDPDDYILDTMCEDMACAARESGADIVIAGLTYCKADGTKSRYHDAIPSGFYDRTKLEKEVFPIMMSHGENIKRSVAPAMWRCWYRKEIIEQVLPFNNEKVKNGTDAACTYACILKADSVFFCENMYHYQYCLNAMSDSKRYNAGWYISAQAFCQWMNSVYKEHSMKELEETFNLEKFYQFYRYIDREFSAETKTVINRIKTMNMVVRIPEIQETIKAVNCDKLNLARLQRYEMRSFQKGMGGFAYLFWKLFNTQQYCKKKLKSVK